MSIPRLTRRQVLAFTIAGGAAPALLAQSEARFLSFVVPQPPGNPSDGMARKIQPILQRNLGLPVVIENLPGAGGSIGLAKVLAGQGAPALMIASQTEPILTPLAISAARYKPEDFQCVGLLGRAPYVLIGRPDLGARTHADLIAQARRAGERPLSYGHIGPGSMIHLLGAEWSRLTRTPVTHIPYKGVPPAVQDLMGGQIDLTFAPLAGTLPSLLESGKVRIYGSTAAAPSARMPGLPLLSKLDPSLADFVYGTWGAVFATRTAPSEFVERVHNAVAEALRAPEVQGYLDGTGLERSPPLSLAQLNEFYRAETALYQRMARNVGVERQ